MKIKKYLCLIFSISLFPMISNSQDIIVTNNETIEGAIIKETDSQIYFREKQKRRYGPTTHLNKKDIQSYEYKENVYQYLKKVSKDSIYLSNEKIYVCNITSNEKDTIYFNYFVDKNKHLVRVAKEYVDHVISATYDTLIYREEIDLVSIGFGAGLNFGGYGMNFLGYPTKYLGLFAGVGYSPYRSSGKVGYNFGLKYRFDGRFDISKINPFLLAMYGYQNRKPTSSNSPAPIGFSQNTFFDGESTGFSFGAGIDIHFKRTSPNYLSFAYLVPIYNKKDAGDISGSGGNLFTGSNHPPVLLTVGYSFSIASVKE